jgi:DNA invertase Pin-like site-specific DNA recombinase
MQSRVDLYLHQQGPTTPAGKALFQMLGVFAEFERAITVQRIVTETHASREVSRTVIRRRSIREGNPRRQAQGSARAQARQERQKRGPQISG